MFDYLHSHQLLLLEFHFIQGIDISLGTGYDHICIRALTDHGLTLLLQFDRNLSLSLCSTGDGI
jgi:hypothetical protein